MNNFLVENPFHTGIMQSDWLKLTSYVTFNNEPESTISALSWDLVHDIGCYLGWLS